MGRAIIVSGIGWAYIWVYILLHGPRDITNKTVGDSNGILLLFNTRIRNKWRLDAQQIDLTKLTGVSDSHQGK